MSQESSLTTPSDRNTETRYRPDQSAPPLTTEQVNNAIETLCDSTFVEKFPAVERRYADPPVHMQEFGLFSFVPAKGATPNDKGIFGFAKMRGNYATMEEADERAELLIRNVDSYHKIFYTVVGRPFPITESSDFSKEINRVDISKEVVETMSADVKKKREKEFKEVEEIKQREKDLLSESKLEEEPKDSRYTTLRVKKAQLSWTYLETKNKLEQMVGFIVKARREIEELDKTNPELKELYMQKYIDSRRQAGLPIEPEVTDKTFMRYMVEDAIIPEVEEEYKALYGNN